MSMVLLVHVRKKNYHCLHYFVYKLHNIILHTPKTKMLCQVMIYYILLVFHLFNTTTTGQFFPSMLNGYDIIRSAAVIAVPIFRNMYFLHILILLLYARSGTWHGGKYYYNISIRTRFVKHAWQLYYYIIICGV